MRDTFKLAPVVALLLASSGAPRAESAKDWLAAENASAALPQIKDEAQLQKVAERLKSPRTRLKALDELLRLASGLLYQTSSSMMFFPDEKTRKLHEHAAALAMKWENTETMNMALQSDVPGLHYWALRAVTAKQPELIPALKALTAPDRSPWNEMALEKLQLFKGTEAFVKQEVASTKDAFILSRQITDDVAFNQRILGLLSDKSPATRIACLNFIGANATTAPMYQRKFDKQIFERVLAISSSGGSAERLPSISALMTLRGFGEAEALRQIVESAKDKSPDVRSMVALRLKSFPAKDTAATLAALRADKVPAVRFYAIAGSDSTKYLEELKQLSHCEDPATCKLAAEMLQGLERAAKQAR